MIDVALQYVKQVLDQYIVTSMAMDRGVVILNGLSSTDSVEAETNRNKVIITLINLEYENNRQFYGGQRREGQHINRVNPAIYFNVDILVSANFDDYSESLKFLTRVISFFQEHLVLDRSTHPSMPVGLEALTFEIENSPSGKMHNLWTALAVSYLPSLLYKIRHIAVYSGQVKGSSAAVVDVSSTVHP